MHINAWRHANLFNVDYALILARFLFALILFELEFTVIHNAANRRNCLRSNFYEIKSAFVCESERLIQGYNAYLITVRVDKTNFFVANVFIDLMF